MRFFLSPRNLLRAFAGVRWHVCFLAFGGTRNEDYTGSLAFLRAGVLSWNSEDQQDKIFALKFLCIRGGRECSEKYQKRHLHWLLERCTITYPTSDSRPHRRQLCLEKNLGFAPREEMG